jgi:hypothetical protein
MNLEGGFYTVEGETRRSLVSYAIFAGNGTPT